MNENLVQWVLLKRPEYLQEKIGFELKRKIGENYTTEQGKIDFAFETANNEILIVELETGINNRAKFQNSHKFRHYVFIESILFFTEIFLKPINARWHYENHAQISNFNTSLKSKTLLVKNLFPY